MKIWKKAVLSMLACVVVGVLSLYSYGRINTIYKPGFDEYFKIENQLRQVNYDWSKIEDSENLKRRYNELDSNTLLYFILSFFTLIIAGMSLLCFFLIPMVADFAVAVESGEMSRKEAFETLDFLQGS